MEKWNFVFLAYGIVWSALLVYVFFLKRRLHRAETERAMTLDLDRSRNHE